jgi:nucleoside 2-deoxyribosyltransferase
MKIAIIHTIKNADQASLDMVYTYVATLEAQGHQVHLPVRDTNQKGTSIEICAHNVKKISEADRVDVFYNSNSLGTHFYLGAAFAFSKPVKVIQSEPLTTGKSFQNLLAEWEKE